MIVQNIRVNKTDFSKQKQRFKPASTNAFEYNEVLNKYENTIKKLYANIINLDPRPSPSSFKEMVINDAPLIYNNDLLPEKYNLIVKAELKNLKKIIE
mgnify:CR=1 FL=1